MSKVETVVFSKSISYLKKTLELLTKEDEFGITGIYTEMEKLLEDLKDINPQLILIVRENEINNGQLKGLINYMNEGVLSKVMLVNFIEDNKFVISEIMSCKDDLSTISKTIRDIYKNRYANDSIYQDYKKLLEGIRFNEVLDKFELTTAEKKILYLKNIGLTRKEIAEKRVVSNETIRNQITKILKKMRASNTEEALCKIRYMIKTNYNC